MENLKMMELNNITDKYREMIKDFDDRMKNTYKVQRVYIP